MTTAVAALHLPLEDVLHKVPLCQLFALSACHAWSAGLEPAEGTYHDRQVSRELARIKAAVPTLDTLPTA